MLQKLHPCRYLYIVDDDCWQQGQWRLKEREAKILRNVYLLHVFNATYSKIFLLTLRWQQKKLLSRDQIWTDTSLEWFAITGFFFPYLYCTILKKSTNVWFIKGILLAHSVFKEENISHLGFHCSQSFDKLCKTIKLNFLWLIKANYIHFNSVGEPQFRDLLFFFPFNTLS